MASLLEHRHHRAGDRFFKLNAEFANGRAFYAFVNAILSSAPEPGSQSARRTGSESDRPIYGPRCHECGLLVPAFDASALNCPNCGILLEELRNPEVVALPPSTQSFSPATARPAPSIPVGRTPLSIGGSAAPAADGRVIVLDPVIHEPADFDLCRAITRTLWMLMLPAAPFVLGWTVLVTVGGFSALLVIGGCAWLLLWLFPSNLLSILHFFVLFRSSRRRDVDQVPVRYFRLRQPDEVEVVVRMKGTLTDGNIGAGDRVACFGLWRQGVLVLLHAFNHTSSSAIRLRRSPWPMALALTVLVLFIGGVWLSAVSHAFFDSINANLRSNTLRY